MSDTLFTVPDAARLLCLSTRQVYLMLRDGKLNAVKIGGATRIRQSELSRYVESLPAYAPRVAATD